LAKRKPSSANGGLLGRLMDRLAEMDADIRRITLRALAIVAGGALLAAGVCAGLSRLEAQVHNLSRYDIPLWLDFEKDSLPPWLRDPGNSYILGELRQKAGLQPTDGLLDRALAARIGQRLAAPRVGWIEKVERVTVNPDGRIAILCRYRTPKAWVQSGKHCYLVDGKSVRLPGTYDIDDCRNSVWMMISGVKSAAGGPPQVGDVWGGDDLASSLRLVGMLDREPFRRQITRIFVQNYRGRRDLRRPHFELATDQPDSRIWWGRPPGEEQDTEINAEQKVALLASLYREYGRIDMNRAYVDIRNWPDRVAMPASSRPVPPRGLLRG